MAYIIPEDMFGKSISRKTKQQIYDIWHEPEWKDVIEYYDGLNDVTRRTGFKKIFRISKLAVGLAIKINEIADGAVKVFPIIDRTYAGFWQRSNGAWSWTMPTITSGTLGGFFPAKFLARPDVKLRVSGQSYDWHVDTDKEGMELYRELY